MLTSNPLEIPSKPWTISVLLGGPSSEREVSLKSGRAVAAVLRERGHRVHEVDAIPGQWKLPEKTDVVFLALHGTYGEDGGVQAELEELGVPYTGCGVEASRLAFDKLLTKEAMVVRGVPTPRYCRVREIAGVEMDWPEGWQPPVVLKPLRQGSSVGLKMVRQRGEWAEAWRSVVRYDNEVLMEELIEGREVTVGIYSGQALPLVEVCPKVGVFDYSNKYTSGATEYQCPAPLSSSLTQAIQDASLRAFEAVGGRDYGRVDVMIGKDEQFYVLEVNTLPGMTETSLLPKAAQAQGISFGDLCEGMLELAFRHPRTHEKES